MIWRLSNRFDPVARLIADRHYNRQKVGTKGFVPPGRCLVLLNEGNNALWVTSWPFGEYVRHAWPGCWVNSCFRKECEGTAHDFIRDAVAATRYRYGDNPLGMVTFINPEFVKPIMRRGKEVWGYSYLCAGFKNVGKTQGGLHAFLLSAEDMPVAEPASSGQMMMELA